MCIYKITVSNLCLAFWLDGFIKSAFVHVSNVIFFFLKISESDLDLGSSLGLAKKVCVCLFVHYIYKVKNLKV